MSIGANQPTKYKQKLVRTKKIQKKFLLHIGTNYIVLYARNARIHFFFAIIRKLSILEPKIAKNIKNDQMSSF